MTAAESTPPPPRIVIIGGGVMGSTIVTALRTSGWPTSHVAVVEPDTARAFTLRENHGVTTYGDITSGVADAQVVVIAVKPQDAGAALSELNAVFPAGALVVTVAAGLPASFYESRLPAGTPVVRVMPNTPAVVAAGATAIAPGSHADDSHVGLVAGMLRATGLTVKVSEDQLNAVTGISGSGPAYFYAFVEALVEAGVAQGLPRVLATQLASQTFVGAAQLLVHSAQTPQALREQVSSPGGTTLAALEAFAAAGLPAVVEAGVAAAVARSAELGNELV